MWSPPVPTPSAVPEAQEGVGCAPAAPHLPGPGQPPFLSQGFGDGSRGLGKPNCQNSSGLQSHLGGWVTSRLCLLCPSGQCLEPPDPPESPRRIQPAAEPYSSHLGLPAWSRVPGLSVFIASVCAVLWARRPAASVPRLGATVPSRPSPDPDRTTVGPSLYSWSCPLPLPSCPFPGQARAWNTQEPVPASPFLTGK